jgi:DNA-binding winged helix-turn-helix (wHTH) protein
MIPKSGYRFSEKIMLKQQAKAKQRTNLKSFRFTAPPRESTPRQWGGAKYLSSSARRSYLVQRGQPR